MDLDVAQVRAFVRTADELHFGRAAGTLAISQQALSKRIARLESLLGTDLFHRGANGVRLTEVGRRFLPPARQTVAAADAAVAAAVGKERPLRVDVWGHLYAPMRTLAQVAGRAGELALGHGRDLPSVTTALLHGDIDAAFGRVHPPLPAGLAHRLVRLEPVDAVLSTRHPLAAEPALRPDQLRDSVLWAPGALDRLDFLHRFADRFAIRATAPSVNLGLAHFLAEVAAEPRRFSLVPADVPLPEVPGLRSVPLVAPTPLYAWSLLWRTGNGHPGLNRLATACAEEAKRSRWLEYDPTRDWLPEPPGPPASGSGSRPA
ncbi:LysR family transcriptional regulator [Streptomyces spectabilis]|uniref:DNA-binding transcriptional LysR family regulator n=1 Tax=Streptomyces spectabilis TaxID=68270 RepID=A0A5P2X4T9_STRST|nr:LysR family transcriptional regulator [Streptomyces spectabilis]MBB5107920.1 DNA-binding transcriptional LysR family regulator [Streptomyces spectabilis]MCI3899750.1 LysR family transcriptional regulator [Streptomyces spectabilis]QEV57422.1 LysR family transcriptional regulator [Streptomyces spectabilis]GGV52059.1 LysR family transcriptional regulator [Streptomyces spectabilis]